MNIGLTDIKLKGTCFEQECTLNLFTKEEKRLSIIYGKNGSGKSSITRAIDDYKNGIKTNFSVIKWYDKDNNEINFTDEEKKQLFIYDEDYIEKNIKIEAEGLKSIVMFGEQIDLDEKINIIKEELKKSKEKTIKIDNEIKKYENDKELYSPKYYYNNILSILKKDGKWAERDAKIKGNKNKSSVRADIVEYIFNNKPVEIKKDIEKDFNSMMTNYEKILKNNNKIEPEIKIINYSNNIEDVVIKLLSKKIKEPVVNDREKKILDAISNGEQNSIEDIKIKFEKEDIDFCPYCFQKVTKEYKKELIKSIQNVLNKDAEEHKNELNEIGIDALKSDYSGYSEIDKRLVEELEKKIDEHNILVGTYKEQINQKKKSIFTAININELGLINSFISINCLLESVEKERIAFNKNIDNIKEMKDNLLILNIKLAWFDIKDDYENYAKQNKKYDDILKTRKQEIDNGNNAINSIKSLNAQKSNVKIALDMINDNLEYIFFSKNRLTLELKGNKYCIKSKGKDIRLKSLSVGERNVIALCYFFSLILDNAEKAKEFTDKCFVILDDPISSFDFENKIGIYSFLKYVFSKILCNNKDSRIIVLTHELEAVFNMQKIASEIYGKKNKDKKSDVKILECNNIKSLDSNKNDYKILIEEIYKFANMETEYEKQELVIGNIMRRVLEAFSTFTYKMNIEDISCSEIVLSNIESQKQRDYFKNLMYRLVLHGESHLEERAYTYTETSFYQYIGIDEKVKTAKDILVFLYLINSGHLTAYFEPNSIDNIKKWSETLYQ